MARLNSFHLPPDRWPDPAAPGARCALDGPEAKHMLKVLRTREGDVVRLFDGGGREGLFVLERADGKRAELRADSVLVHDRPASSVTLAVGWNKSSRRGWLLEKAVELGAGGVAFWQARRSQGGPSAEPKESWQEKCVQAAKQCGSPFLPELDVVADGAAGVLAFAKDFDRCYLPYECEREALLHPAMLAPSSSEGEAARGGRVLIVIGPEGGFDPEEAETLIAGGCAPVSLGRSVLRWETAALHCLSLALYAREAAGVAADGRRDKVGRGDDA